MPEGAEVVTLRAVPAADGESSISSVLNEAWNAPDSRLAAEERTGFAPARLIGKPSGSGENPSHMSFL